MTTLLDRHDLVLADLDGTLYQGREAIPGAVAAVVAAAEKGVRTLYVTNNASRAPGDVAVHLAELGYPADPHRSAELEGRAELIFCKAFELW